MLVYHEERGLARGLFVEVGVVALSLLVEVVLILHLLLHDLRLVIVALIVVAMVVAIGEIAYSFEL